MKVIPISPAVDSFSVDIPKDAKKLFSSRKRYFLREVNILQESYVFYRSEASCGICFTFRDYGVRDIKNIGFSLIVETMRHSYMFQQACATVNYMDDNQFKIHIVDLQRIPIVRCRLVFNWILYMDRPVQNHNDGTIRIEGEFERPTKIESEYMIRVKNAREACLVERNNRCSRKSAFPEESISTAWKVYDELLGSFEVIQRANDQIKQHHKTLQLTMEENKSSEIMAVPVSCYFDKGFYSTVYYAGNYPIIEKRLSGGKSAIQCVLGVDKAHLDVLLYLYYCTLDQRGYYQHFTDEQIQLKDYLDKNHPVMRVKQQLDQLAESYPKCDIVLKSDVYISARALVDTYFQKMKDARENAFNALVAKGLTHGKWVNEYKLYTLVRAMFPDAEYQYSADWLDGQWLDIYVPSISCAIEYQGEQHYHPVDFFGGEEHFMAQREMDKQKRDKCIANGVHLLEWPYSRQISLTTLYILLQGIIPEDSLTYDMIYNQIAAFPVESLADFLNKPLHTQSKKFVPKTPKARTHEIRKYDVSGTYLCSYASVSEAAEQEKLSVGGIGKVIYKERRTAGGFQWRRCEINSEKTNIEPID